MTGPQDASRCSGLAPPSGHPLLAPHCSRSARASYGLQLAACFPYSDRVAIMLRSVNLSDLHR